MKRILPTQPKVALVLGGGGLNCLAAIPLIQFLEARRIRPALLVGCSGGCIPLALWACGYRGRDMMDCWNRLNTRFFTKDWRSIAAMFGLGRGFTRELCFFKTGPIFQVLRDLYGERRLEGLDPPLVLQATDFETGEGVELDSGDLAEAVYASSAAYPFLHPILFQGRWLFDGLFTAPVPVLPAVRRGVDVILAVNFLEDLRPEPTSIFEAMFHLNALLAQSVYQSQMLASIDLHRHEILQIQVRLHHVGATQMWDPGAFERIQAAGRKAVAEYGPEILALVQGARLLPRAWAPARPTLKWAGRERHFNRGEAP